MVGIPFLSVSWFRKTICFIVEKIGLLPLSAHTVAYDLIPVSILIPLDLSIGLIVSTNRNTFVHRRHRKGKGIGEVRRDIYGYTEVGYLLEFVPISNDNRFISYQRSIDFWQIEQKLM